MIHPNLMKITAIKPTGRLKFKSVLTCTSVYLIVLVKGIIPEPGSSPGPAPDEAATNLLSNASEARAFFNPQSSASVATNSSRFNRVRRGVINLAGMINCVAGCDPLLYQNYGCYCGYSGTGTPIDAIDRCCLQHDWCYSYATCPQLLIYVIPYQWQCIAPGYARCGIPPYGLTNERCSRQLCECDRVFAQCISRFECPQFKPVCRPNVINFANLG